MSEVKVNKLNTRTNTALTIQQNSTTAMTIDTSQNVLVGKTSDSFSTAGAKIQQNGQLGLTASSNEGISINRLNSDGSQIIFYKDGTNRGNIGTFSNLPYFAGASYGMLVGSDNLVPSTNTGAVSDNQVDLGASNRRFNDLYLGGNIYLGGTGSANALDDYEEGTWTPTFEGFTATTQNAQYTKIGNIVHIQVYISSVASGTSTSAKIKSLPFTCVSNGWSPFIVQGQFSGVGFTYHVLGRVASNNTELTFRDNNDNPIQGTNFDTTSFALMQFTYKTNS